MLTLVIYDISNDKDRNKLAELLLDFGLERIQYSGFKGNLNFHDCNVLAKKVKQFISSSNDSIYIIRLCNECVKTCKIVSKRDIPLIDESMVKIV